MFWFKFLDYFFLVFHLCIVIFNLTGWIWKRTRKANLLLLLLTGGSWFGLGIIYGFGYCPFTDWHWQVLDHLGDMPKETSYMQYMLSRVFSIHLSTRVVDLGTLISYIAALWISVILNIRDFRRKKITL
ncbi:MAG TPA: DUF2784 family protein [Lentimicrobium sp.]|nr:DUF2784 family protein [Lentimicrobium sp.]